MQFDYSRALESIDAAYRRYVDMFRSDGGNLFDLLELKDIHTARVVENIAAIASSHTEDPFLRYCCMASARLHDVGRFEQLKTYGTFRDSQSIDHAQLSYRIMSENRWLDGMEGAKCILDAVLFHNRRELPENIDAATEFVANALRDADKLDIFNVLEERVKNTDWEKDCSAFWNLPVAGLPNGAVVSAIRKGLPVDYRDIKSLSDFVLIQIGWMINELHFSQSRRICRERGHLEFRKAFLQKLTGGGVTDELCDLADGALQH